MLWNCAVSKVHICLWQFSACFDFLQNLSRSNEMNNGIFLYVTCLIVHRSQNEKSNVCQDLWVLIMCSYCNVTCCFVITIYSVYLLDRILQLTYAHWVRFSADASVTNWWLQLLLTSEWTNSPWIFVAVICLLKGYMNSPWHFRISCLPTVTVNEHAANSLLLW